MAVVFTFSVISQNSVISEVGSRHFAHLFDVDKEFLSQLGFMDLSFVREYRESRLTMQEWLLSKSEEELVYLAFGESNAGRTVQQKPEVAWEASRHFAADDARLWAMVWINILDDLTAKETLALFPLAINLLTRESLFDVGATVEDLRKLVQLARRAGETGEQMRLRMRSDNA